MVSYRLAFFAIFIILSTDAIRKKRTRPTEAELLALAESQAADIVSCQEGEKKRRGGREKWKATGAKESKRWREGTRRRRKEEKVGQRKRWRATGGKESKMERRKEEEMESQRVGEMERWREGTNVRRGEEIKEKRKIRR